MYDLKHSKGSLCLPIFPTNQSLYLKLSSLQSLLGGAKTLFSLDCYLKRNQTLQQSQTLQHYKYLKSKGRGKKNLVHVGITVSKLYDTAFFSANKSATFTGLSTMYL